MVQQDGKAKLMSSLFHSFLFVLCFQEIARNLKQTKAEGDDAFTEIQLDEGDTTNEAKLSLGKFIYF